MVGRSLTNTMTVNEQLVVLYMSFAIGGGEPGCSDALFSTIVRGRNVGYGNGSGQEASIFFFLTVNLNEG